MQECMIARLIFIAGVFGGIISCKSGLECQETLFVPSTSFFSDISVQSGLRTENYVLAPAVSIPINDHSRLAFAEINGDGFDDVVMHSLFPNPQVGIPFEHLVFLNDGAGGFSDFSDASGLRAVQSGFFAFGDVDNDGDQDIFSGLDISYGTHTHQILLNDGQGHFSVRANSGVEVLTRAAANAVFADFNGDALLDLYIGMGGTTMAVPDVLMLGVGDGSFTNASSQLAGNSAQPSNGTTTCDYDNDGDLDIFVSTYGVSINAGLNILWENDAGSFVNTAVDKNFASQATGNTYLEATDYGTAIEPDKAPGTFMGSNGFGIDCDDFNNDGNMDIFLSTISHPVASDYKRTWSDPTQLLLNLGPSQNYTFANVSQLRHVPFNEGDVDAAMVDFDNDGLIDLSLSRDKKYEKSYEDIEQKAWFALLHQQSDGTFKNLGPSSGINALDAEVSASLSVCASDSDCSDSQEKCFKEKCRHPCTTSADCGASEELCHSGGFCKIFARMKNAQNHAWSDIDQDGDVDLLVGGRDTGGGRPNFLFRNEIGSQNRWLAFVVEGDGEHVSRDAFGTRISIKGTEKSVLREKKSSRGMYNSEDTRVLHFGLGSLSCAYDIEVRWPDGVQATFQASDLSEQRYYRLSYPDQLQEIK